MGEYREEEAAGGGEAPRAAGAARVEPCPFCGDAMKVRERSAFHPRNDLCWLSEHELDDCDYSFWNRRAPTADLLRQAREALSGAASVKADIERHTSGDTMSNVYSDRMKDWSSDLREAARVHALLGGQKP